MSRPLKIQNTTPTSLKEMSNTEIEYAAHRLLVAFAASNSGVGTLSVNPGTVGSLTLIGTFTDTYRPYAVGAHPVDTTIISNTYNFYQNLVSDSTSVTIKPVRFTSGQGITVQTNTNIESYLIPIAASRLVADGLGSYKLQTTSPTVGGTWSSIATITDAASGGNTATYLWRRDTQTAPTTSRPLKQDLIGNQYSLKEMSDAELEALVPYLRNYIVSSGIGQYRLQQSSPVGGTWVAAGTSFSDTREQLGAVSYTGNYSGTYSNTFIGAYTGNYSNTFTGTYTGNYSNTFTGTYGGSYVGTFSREFTGGYALYYSGYNLAGDLFTGTFQGANKSFTGAAAFTGNTFSRTFLGGYRGFYTGNFSNTFAGTYSGSYSNTFIGSYSGGYANNFSGTYTGNYSGQTVLATKDTVSTVTLWIRTA